MTNKVVTCRLLQMKLQFDLPASREAPEHRAVCVCVFRNHWQQQWVGSWMLQLTQVALPLQ